MSLFEWTKDIEKTYEKLIKDAKDINLKNIEEFRDQQRMYFEYYLEEKNDLINNALSELANDVRKGTEGFETQMDKAIKIIEKDFKKEIENLHKLIIDEVGLDF